MPVQIFDYRKLYLDNVETFIKIKEYDEAEFLLRHCIEIFPGHCDLYWKLAEVFLLKGELDRARSITDIGLEKDSEVEAGYRTHAKVLRAQKEFARFLDEIPCKLSAFPMWHNVRREYAEVLEEQKNYSEALVQRRVIAEGTNLYLDKACLAKTMICSGAREEGLLNLQILLNELEITPEALVVLGEIFLELGEIDTFRRFLPDVIKLVGADVQIFLEWARALAKMSHEQEALALLEAGLALCDSKELRLEIATLRSRIYGRSPVAHIWRSPLSPRRVIFVSESPKIREAKLAYGLRAQGWEVILLHKNPLNSDPTRYFDAEYTYSTAQQALDIVSRIEGKLFHVFSPLIDPTVLAFLNEKPGVMIYDYIDVFDGLIYFNYDSMVAQRAVFEQVDAMVCRDLQVARSNAQSGRFRASDICFFPEYCWNTLPEYTRPQRDPREIHVVQGGWINIQKPQKRIEESYFDILSRFAECDIHVHLYAHMMFKKEHFAHEYGDLVELGKRTGHAHLHDTVPFHEVAQEFMQYDFGLSVVPNADFPGHSSRYPKQAGHFESCGSARNTDYMDSALPVLSSPMLRFQHWMADRYGVVVPFISEEFLVNPRAMLEPYCNEATRREVIRRRSPYTIAAQTPRLIRFYEHLQQKYRITKDSFSPVQGEKRRCLSNPMICGRV